MDGVNVVHAAEKEKPRRSTRRTPAIRAKIFEKLNEAQVAADEKRYSEAIKLLDALRDKEGRGSLNSYELANLYNMYAFIYFTQEKYEQALTAYRNVVKQPDIPEAMELNTKAPIAQLYFVKEDYKNGVKVLLEWFKAKKHFRKNPCGFMHCCRAITSLRIPAWYIEVAITITN